jgi:hypothetical protein
MDVKQSLGVIAKYRALLEPYEPEVANMDEFPSREEIRRHLLHMLNHMEEMLDSKKFPVTNWDKFNRWLGFVQGCLWNLREFTLNDMREHNMRPEKKNADN